MYNLISYAKLCPDLDFPKLLKMKPKPAITISVAFSKKDTKKETDISHRVPGLPFSFLLFLLDNPSFLREFFYIHFLSS